jgi:hypothetical protein
MVNRILGSFLLFAVLMACDENAEILKLKSEVSPNEVKSLSVNEFVLSRENENESFEQFQWTATDFGFPAVVTYTLQMDRAGNNFGSPVEIVTTPSLAGTISVGQLNQKLLSMNLDPESPSEIELRVRSRVSDYVPAVFSAVRTITVTPYATVFPPIYMIGDATGGWNLALAVETKSIAPGIYETTAEFTNGGRFRFFLSPSWDAEQYNWSTFAGGTVDSRLTDAGDNDGNILFNDVTGWYKITVDVRNKSVVMVQTERPALYMIGAAIKGWDLAQAVEMERLSDGVFKATTSFTAGETFRFFTKPDWSAGTINYPYFADGSVDPLFENAGDGDSNFKFVGETGDYTITVDLNELTVVMETPGDPEPIYMIGDATGGWDLTFAVEVPGTGTSTYETIADFTNGGKFRFFTAPDWNAQQYNWAYFEGGNVDDGLQNGADSDGNFLFAGASGSYKITVDLQAKSIVLELQ